jgi:putative ABC transport system permease protein
MRITDIIKTAGSNLFRNKTRSILTIIAVFVGATTITLTNGIGDGIKSYLSAQVDGLGAENVLIITADTMQEDTEGPQKYNPNRIQTGSSTAGPQAQGPGGLSPFLLTNEDLKIISSDKDIEVVKPFINVAVNYISRPNAPEDQRYLAPIDSARAEFTTIDLKVGEQLDLSSNKPQVVIPSSYVVALGFNNENEALNEEVVLFAPDQLGGGKEFTANIVGVSNASLIAGESISINPSLAESITEINNKGKSEQAKNTYSTLIASFSNELNEEEILALQTRIENQGYNTLTIKEQQSLIFGVIDGIVVVLNMFGIVALTAASFGIINTLYMAVQERTKEIGLMKAVGMSKNKIFALFSIEAALLGLLGSGFGILIANGLARVINNIAANSFLSDFEGLELLSIQWQSALTIVLLITTVAFLAGTLPARRASKLDAIEALRYE